MVARQRPDPVKADAACIFNRLDDDGQRKGEVRVWEGEKQACSHTPIGVRKRTDFERGIHHVHHRQLRGWINDTDHGKVTVRIPGQHREVHVKHTVLKQGEFKFGLVEQRRVIDRLDHHGHVDAHRFGCPIADGQWDDHRARCVCQRKHAQVGPHHGRPDGPDVRPHLTLHHDLERSALWIHNVDVEVEGLLRIILLKHEGWRYTQNIHGIVHLAHPHLNRDLER